MLRKGLFFVIFIFCAKSAFSNENKSENLCPAKPDCLEEITETTQHEAKINGRTIKYTATAGTIVLRNKEGEGEASIFYVAYTKNNENDLSKRPVTFCFNGGPGSSSVWLHLGAIGPRRLAMNVDGTPERPYHLVDNEYSLLDITDLVFIDPVSTGYSRVAPDVDANKFHGVEQDIQSVGEFIRLYTTQNGRWTSPKFIAGESYGTTRATGLANHLYDKTRMEMNGILLISAVLDFQAYYFSMGNDLPYITFLPTYTNIAWYHKKLDKSLLQDFFKTQEEVKEFALGEYARALVQGNRLKEKERNIIAEKLSRYTGLDKDYILKSDLRVNMASFVKKLMNGEDRLVSRFDGRMLGIDENPTSSRVSYDPMLSLVAPAFTSTMNQYLRDELNWKETREYEILAMGLFPKWDWSKAKNQYLNMNEDLLDLMSQNPHFRVFVASGYYDLATPFEATDYTFAHLPIDPILERNITIRYYDAGHMMYIHKPSLVKLKRDMADFVRGTL